jgi:chromosome segregation ATPase
MELRLQAAILVLNRRYSEAQNPIQELMKLTGGDAPVFQLLESQHRLRERESRIDELRRQHAELAARHEEMRRRHAELERQYREDADENSRKQQVLFNLQLECEQKASNLTEVRELTLREKDLREQNALIRGEIASVRQAGDRWKTEGEVTAHEIAALRAEHEDLRRYCLDERAGNEELRNRLAQAEREHHAARAEHEALIEEQHAIESRLHELASLINKKVGDVQTDPFDNKPLVQFLQDVGQAKWPRSVFRNLQMDIDQLRRQLEHTQQRIAEYEAIHEQRVAQVELRRAGLARLQQTTARAAARRRS